MFNIRKLSTRMFKNQSRLVASAVNWLNINDYIDGYCGWKTERKIWKNVCLWVDATALMVNS